MSHRLARLPGEAKRALRRPDSLLDSDLANRVLDRGLHTSDVAVEPEHVLPRALRYLGVSDRDTFVDFGCGKGRVVHQAARRRFQRVIGVEVSPALAEIARSGLAARSRQHRCGSVDIVVCDVTQYRIPEDLTIGYLFHPFSGETFDTVVRNIVGSIDRRPRRVRLIYVNPVFGGEILATGRFRLVKWLRGGLRDRRLFRAAIFESF
jgi:SAM-dependent methyltransferase